MNDQNSVIQWLLEGDASIRWQTQRNLTDASDDQVERERGRVATAGWGARLLAMQDQSGN